MLSTRCITMDDGNVFHSIASKESFVVDVTGSTTFLAFQKLSVLNIIHQLLPTCGMA